MLRTGSVPPGRPARRAIALATPAPIAPSHRTPTPQPEATRVLRVDAKTPPPPLAPPPEAGDDAAARSLQDRTVLLGETTDDSGESDSSASPSPPPLTSDGKHGPGAREEAGESKATLALLRAAGIGVHERPGALVSDDRVVSGSLAPFGHGACSTVLACQVRLPGAAAPTDMVFKAEPLAPRPALARRVPVAGTFSGARDNWAGRAVASWRLSERLGLAVIPRTEYAVVDGKAGSVMALAPGVSPLFAGQQIRIGVSPETGGVLARNPTRLGALLRSWGLRSSQLQGATLVLSNAPPLPADQVQPAGPSHRVLMDFEHPVLRRELTRLQWVDILSGQVDRHSSNYIVVVALTAGQCVPVGVLGIDNDLSFGHRLGSVRDLVEREAAHPTTAAWVPNGFHGTELPRLIDADLRKALLGLDEQALRDTLAGAVSPASIRAAAARLKEIQQRLSDTRDPVLEVREDKEWASAEASERLGVRGLPAGGVKRSRQDSPLRAGALRVARLERLAATAALTSYVARDTIAQSLAQARLRLSQDGEPAPMRQPVLDLGGLGELAARAKHEGLERHGSLPRESQGEAPVSPRPPQPRVPPSPAKGIKLARGMTRAPNSAAVSGRENR